MMLSPGRVITSVESLADDQGGNREARNDDGIRVVEARDFRRHDRVHGAVSRMSGVTFSCTPYGLIRHVHQAETRST